MAWQMEETFLVNFTFYFDYLMLSSKIGLRKMERKNLYYFVSVLMIISAVLTFPSIFMSINLIIAGIFDFYSLVFLIGGVVGLVILIFPSVYYIRNAKNKKLNNKIYYSAITYFISFILGIIGIVLSFIPCFTGLVDGFCMLGIIYVVPIVILVWVIAFVLFVWGRISQSTIK